MLNKTILMGRLTNNPELKHTTSGTTYVNFSLAVERDFKDKQSGEKVTDFIDFIAWGNTSEFICRYFTKGRMMIVSGRIQTDSYNDKDGNKRKSTKVVVENAYFGDSKRDGDQGQQPQTASAPMMADQFATINGDDDELPFV